jgi:hypothetical protein
MSSSSDVASLRPAVMQSRPVRLQRIDIYRQDLADRDMSISKPADPFRDESWRKTLERTYLSPFTAQAAGDYQWPNSRPSIDSKPRRGQDDL